MRTLHFRKVYDASCLEKLVCMYLQDETGEKYIITDLVVEKYEPNKIGQVKPLNEFQIKVDEQELKRMSKELYEDLSEQTQYLKGNLEATKQHLDDMRLLVFKKGK
jgi:hypothetical protein